MLRFSPRLSTFSCVLACAHARRSRRAPAARRPDCSPRARRQARLDVDDRGVRVEQAAQVGAHGLLVRRQLGALQDDGRVHVAQPVARRASGAPGARRAGSRRAGGAAGRRAPRPAGAHRLAHKHVGRLALPPRVAVREELPDVRLAQRAQDGVCAGSSQSRLSPPDQAGPAGQPLAARAPVMVCSSASPARSAARVRRGSGRAEPDGARGPHRPSARRSRGRAGSPGRPG